MLFSCRYPEVSPSGTFSHGYVPTSVRILLELPLVYLQVEECPGLLLVSLNLKRNLTLKSLHNGLFLLIDGWSCQYARFYFGRVFKQFRIAKCHMGADFMWPVLKAIYRADFLRGERTVIQKNLDHW